MNKYEIVETLGQGGYGRANLVCRKSDKKLFVEKEVRLASMKPKDKESAIQEAKLLASLKHPYIVEYEESFEENGYLYILMEYADGGDLSKKIESRGKKLFKEDEILHDFIEISLAIKYIHDRKICHRDLKGQNIFLTKDGTIKLGDFGISKVLESTFQGLHTQIGTPFYLSPEICNGMEYNTKTDIWSLGCILYELCTLKHAFSGNNIQVLMVNIIQARYSPIPSHYSQDLRNLVDKMLTKEPEKRPTINQILNLPFLKKRLGNFLDKDLLEYEMGHTRLHNRKPFAPPTIIIGKDQKQEQQQPQQNSEIEFEDLREKQLQLQAKEAFLDKKEAEIAAREKAQKEEIAAREKALKAEIAAREKAQKEEILEREKARKAEIQARNYIEQKKEILGNKARMQREMSGDSMKYALQNQYPDSNNDNYEDDRKYRNQFGYEDQARENYLEQLRMARANRERMKREEFQGNEMKKALMDVNFSEDDDNYRKNRRKAESEDFKELNEYMRQQRKEAAANKRRIEEALRGSAAKAAMAQQDEREELTKNQKSQRKNLNEKGDDYEYDYSDYYSDYSEPKQPQKKTNIDNKELNEYMRQLRHERRANMNRAQEYEKRANMNIEDGELSSLNAKNQQKQSVVHISNNQKIDISQEEIEEYMKEQRRKRRENKAKIEAMGQINMDQIIAEAESQQNLGNKKQETANKSKIKSKRDSKDTENIEENNDKKEEVKVNNINEKEEVKENFVNDNAQSKCCLLI